MPPNQSSITKNSMEVTKFISSGLRVDGWRCKKITIVSNYVTLLESYDGFKKCITCSVVIKKGVFTDNKITLVKNCSHLKHLFEYRVARQAICNTSVDSESD
jgi:hypothetical protein